MTHAQTSHLRRPITMLALGISVVATGIVFTTGISNANADPGTAPLTSSPTDEHLAARAEAAGVDIEAVREAMQTVAEEHLAAIAEAAGVDIEDVREAMQTVHDQLAAQRDTFRAEALTAASGQRREMMQSLAGERRQAVAEIFSAEFGIDREMMQSLLEERRQAVAEIRAEFGIDHEPIHERMPRTSHRMGGNHGRAGDRHSSATVN